MKKNIYLTKEDKGLFIFFLDYEGEENFEGFLTFLTDEFGMITGEINVYPYNLYADVIYKGIQISATSDDAVGCYLFFPKEFVNAGESFIAENNLK